MDNFADVLCLTDRYNANKPMRKCVEFMKKHITLDDFCWVLHLANRYNCRELRTFCIKQIRRKWQSTLDSDGFLECDFKVVEELARMYCIDRDDKILLKRCIEWAKRSCQRKGLDDQIPTNLRNELGTLTEFITPSMTFEDCLKSVNNQNSDSDTESKLASGKDEQSEKDGNETNPNAQEEIPDEVDPARLRYTYEAEDDSDDFYFGWGDDTEEYDTMDFWYIAIE